MNDNHIAKSSVQLSGFILLSLKAASDTAEYRMQRVKKIILKDAQKIYRYTVSCVTPSECKSVMSFVCSQPSHSLPSRLLSNPDSLSLFSRPYVTCLYVAFLPRLPLISPHTLLSHHTTHLAVPQHANMSQPLSLWSFSAAHLGMFFLQLSLWLSPSLPLNLCSDFCFSDQPSLTTFFSYSVTLIGISLFLWS